MKWQKKEILPEEVRSIASRYGLDMLTSSILLRRGITSPEDILFYLEDDSRYLHNSFLFNDMEDAIDRILAAIDEKEKVLVFGDRDVDGITSTVIMHETLLKLGLDVTWKIPTGDDPYGLTNSVIDSCIENYISLIITVDCGISNHDEISYAKEKGIDVIIVDHHLGELPHPEAIAIIDPKLENSGYPFKDLAGCGVAYKVIRALKFAQTEIYKQQVCLINIRPVNEAFVIEAVKLANMVEKGRLIETLVPGMVDVSKTRLVQFFEGQQILAYDVPLQKKMLSKVLGTSIEMHLLDIAPEIWKELPNLTNLSLLRLKDLSKIARYREGTIGELDVFINLFISFILKKSNCYGDDDIDLLELVALGTIADLMPLVNENRILVKKGLKGINTKPRKGILELLVKKDLLGKNITAHEIAWQVTPVINAAGRMGKPETAVNLLLDTIPLNRNAFASSIIEMNEARKKLGQETWDKIKPLADISYETFDSRMIIVGCKDIHRGITGILAARLASTYNVPSCVVSFMSNDSMVGSMRSARGVNVKAFLGGLQDLFIDYGGHSEAAGFSIKPENWESFLERSKDLAIMLDMDIETNDSIMIDAEIPLDYMNPDLIALTERFEPCGTGSESLVFCSRNLHIQSLDLMGKPEPLHVKLLLDSGSFKWPAVYWKASERVPRDFALHDSVDAIFKIGKNIYGGVSSPQLTIIDVERSN